MMAREAHRWEVQTLHYTNRPAGRGTAECSCLGLWARRRQAGLIAGRKSRSRRCQRQPASRSPGQGRAGRAARAATGSPGWPSAPPGRAVRASGVVAQPSPLGSARTGGAVTDRGHGGHARGGGQRLRRLSVRASRRIRRGPPETHASEPYRFDWRDAWPPRRGPSWRILGARLLWPSNGTGHATRMRGAANSELVPGGLPCRHAPVRQRRRRQDKKWTCASGRGLSSCCRPAGRAMRTTAGTPSPCRLAPIREQNAPDRTANAGAVPRRAGSRSRDGPDGPSPAGGGGRGGRAAAAQRNRDATRQAVSKSRLRLPCWAKGRRF